MIYVTGDIHANLDQERLDFFKSLKEDDVMIVLGDFGFSWNEQLRNSWNALNIECLTLSVLGNHENYNLIKSCAVERVFGANTLKLNPRVDSYIYKGKELINQMPYGDFKGIGLQLYRAPLDNDMNMNVHWRKKRLDAQSCFAKKFRHTVKSDCVVITGTVTVKTPKVHTLAVTDIELSVYGNGTIRAKYRCTRGGKVKNIPRFGVQLEMPKNFKNVRYFGLGPFVNLPDFKEHTLTGVYSTAIWDMHENHIKPQESAVRCDVRFAQITDCDGMGFSFEAIDKPFVFSANPFTPQQCAKAMHKEDLPKGNTSCINIDAEILGAGSNACGPLTSNKYRLGKLKGKKLSFVVKPIGD